MTVVRVLGRAIPAGGGGYLRHLPYRLTRRWLRRAQRARPIIVYAHPYELDTEPPSDAFARALGAGDKAARKHHARQIRNRSTVERKLTRLLGEFDFGPLGALIDLALGGGEAEPLGERR